MFVMVLSSVGIPVEGLALILGMDRPLDMLRTVVNVTGDATVACMVEEGEKNRKGSTGLGVRIVNYLIPPNLIFNFFFGVFDSIKKFINVVPLKKK